MAAYDPKRSLMLSPQRPRNLPCQEAIELHDRVASNVLRLVGKTTALKCHFTLTACSSKSYRRTGHGAGSKLLIEVSVSFLSKFLGSIAVTRR